MKSGKVFAATRVGDGGLRGGFRQHRLVPHKLVTSQSIEIFPSAAKRVIGEAVTTEAPDHSGASFCYLPVGPIKVGGAVPRCCEHHHRAAARAREEAAQ